MYSVGEFVVHPGQGVCEVKAVSEGPAACYELQPVGLRNPMTISFPVASEDRLRPVVSKTEAADIIDGYPSMQVDPSADSITELEEAQYRKKIRNGSCRESVRIAKTFRRRIAEAKARNRKPPITFERILKQASERSLCEMAVALDMSSEDVWALFEKRLEASER